MLMVSCNLFCSYVQNSQEMFALEVRQEALLERLRHLKQQLDQLQGNKGVTATVSHTTPVPVIGAAAHSSPLKVNLQEFIQIYTL